MDNYLKILVGVFLLVLSAADIGTANSIQMALSIVSSIIGLGICTYSIIGLRSGGAE